MADADQRTDEADVVERPADVLGRDEAERDPSADGEEHRREGELDGRREALASNSSRTGRCVATLSPKSPVRPASGTCRTARRAAGRGRMPLDRRDRLRCRPLAEQRLGRPARSALVQAKTRNETPSRTGMARMSRRPTNLRIRLVARQLTRSSLLLDRHGAKCSVVDGARHETLDVRAGTPGRLRVRERHARQEVHDLPVGLLVSGRVRFVGSARLIRASSSAWPQLGVLSKPHCGLSVRKNVPTKVSGSPKSPV